MTVSRLSAAAVALAAVPAFLSLDAQAQGTHHRSASASAPCSGSAGITVQLRARADKNDLLTVSVSGAYPRREWRVKYFVDGDHYGFGISTREQTDGQGAWQLQHRALTGRQTLSASARSESGQQCQVSLVAKVSRRT